MNWDVDQLPREQRASLNWDLPAMPIVLESPTNWTILHMTMEYEYMDVNPLGFFSEVGGWYLRGHFPCGWEGSFPEGRLIVY